MRSPTRRELVGRRVLWFALSIYPASRPLGVLCDDPGFTPYILVSDPF